MGELPARHALGTRLAQAEKSAENIAEGSTHHCSLKALRCMVGGETDPEGGSARL